MARSGLLLVGCLSFSVILRPGAFVLTTAEVAMGGAVELMPIGAFLGLYRSLPISLFTVISSYGLFSLLRGKNYYLLLLTVPVMIGLFDFANDLALAINLGIVG